VISGVTLTCLLLDNSSFTCSHVIVAVTFASKVICFIMTDTVNRIVCLHIQDFNHYQANADWLRTHHVISGVTLTCLLLDNSFFTCNLVRVAVIFASRAIHVI
jgi:hypothetical protein